MPAGLKRAKAARKRLGRPTVAPTVEAKVRGLRRQGKGMIAIAREVRCCVGEVQRIVVSV